MNKLLLRNSKVTKSSCKRMKPAGEGLQDDMKLQGFLFVCLFVINHFLRSVKRVGSQRMILFCFPFPHKT